MESFQDNALQPFQVSNPKLLSQKDHSQVFLCDAFKLQSEENVTPCVLKFFSSKAQSAYKRELAVYSLADSSTELQKSVPIKLWSGTWTGEKYRKFIGTNLPKLPFRKPDCQISVIALQYIHSTYSISNAPEDLRFLLARAALHSLRRLHTNRITHGGATADHLLIQLEDPVGYSAYWIGFSSSTVKASTETTKYEWDKAVEYFSDFTGVDASLIVPSEELSPLPSPLISKESIPPINMLQDDTIFQNVTNVTEGTHSVIYKVTVINERLGTFMPACLKLFHEDDMTPYNLETTAYAVLNHAGVEYYIPKVYGVGKRTLSDWGIKSHTVEETEYHGILMEWIEGGQQLNSQNVTIDHAITLVRGLSKIHDAGVLHFDTFERNILVVPGSKRALWIDFSCAQTELVMEPLFPQEAYMGGGLAIQYLYEQAIEKTKADLDLKSLFSSMSISRRTSVFLYVCWSLFESICMFPQSSLEGGHNYGSFEIVLLKVVCFLLYLVLLRSLVEFRFAKLCFHGIMISHQLFSGSISLCKIFVGTCYERIWYGLRLFVIVIVQFRIEGPGPGYRISRIQRRNTVLVLSGQEVQTIRTSATPEMPCERSQAAIEKEALVQFAVNSYLSG